MFAKGPVGAPRHMAGSKRTDRTPVARAAATPAAPAPLDMVDVPQPVARVHRSRLAVAVSMTIAAVPILVLDNFPATADTGAGTEVEAATAAEAPAPLDGPTTTIVVEAPSTTVTTAAPTTESTDAEPAATTAPPTTTEAPEPQIRSMRAPVAELPAPTTTTTAAPAPTSTAPAPAPAGDPNDPATWDELARCESGGNWALNTGNGYYGGLQFSLASWQEVGGTGHPHEHSREEQIRRGQILQARYGWGQWPSCSRRLGYR